MGTKKFLKLKIVLQSFIFLCLMFGSSNFALAAYSRTPSGTPVTDPVNFQVDWSNISAPCGNFWLLLTGNNTTFLAASTSTPNSIKTGNFNLNLPFAHYQGTEIDFFVSNPTSTNPTVLGNTSCGFSGLEGSAYSLGSCPITGSMCTGSGNTSNDFDVIQDVNINPSSFWTAIAGTTGSLIQDSFPMWEWFVGGILAFMGSLLIFFGLIKAVKKLTK